MSITKPPAQGSGIVNTMVKISLKPLLILATETWRIKRKLSRFQNQNTTDEIIGLIASTERMESCFQQLGIVCTDYDDKPYDEGLHVKVLDYENSPKINTGVELIVRTIVPGIFINGNLCQEGEVVVARGTCSIQEVDDAEHC